jgi:dTDP-4-amino-4,6-dideoxygalactose transaminase
MIPLAKPNIGREEERAVLEVLRSGWWTCGTVAQTLEQEFAEYVGSRHAVAVSSCSSALFLALKALNLPAGSLVIVPTLTFCSTVNSVLLNGLVPVLVDVDRQTQCIDVRELEMLVDVWGVVRMSGILPVHFAGDPCDMDVIMKLADKNDWFVVGDCAHAVETEWRGRKVGGYGLASCYSFNPIKNVAAPEMGMVTTDDDEVANRVRSMRLHCMSVDAFDRVRKPGSYDITDLGYKMNCTDVEAAVALCQLRKIGENWQRRLYIHHRYTEMFGDLYIQGKFNGQYPSSGPGDFRTVRAHHLYTIQLNNRDDFILKMREKGIYCGIHYKPVHLHPYYKGKLGYGRGDFPNAEWIGDHTVSLPLGPGMTDVEVDAVMRAVEDILREGDYLFDQDNL